MRISKHYTSIIILLFISILVGCQTIPKDALQLKPESLENRQLQTRKFNSLSEQDALMSAAGVLQDMGFTITESETKLGVLVGSKDRSAVHAGEVAGAILLTLLSGATTHYSKNQQIIASLVTTPVVNDKGIIQKNSFYLRVTFARLVWNTNNQLTIAEQLTDSELYQEFFDKFSKSVFLEGQKI